MPNPRNLNNILGAIGDELKNLGRIWKDTIPAINCLVVNQHTRMPQKHNPLVIGLPKKLTGETEYAFLSADKIDVLFKSPSAWIGVEVKGERSNEPDLMRGIFQCIKYKSLMEAAQRYDQVKVSSRPSRKRYYSNRFQGSSETSDSFSRVI